MLASQFRLKKSRDIARVLKSGRFGTSSLLLVKSRPNNLDSSRAVVVVSKKISKKATVRNRIRRRLQGCLEQVWATLPAGYDIVVSVRQDPGELPAAGLQQQLKVALERAGLKS